MYDLTHQLHEGAKDLTVPTKALEQKFIETRDDYIRKINSAIDITLKNANFSAGYAARRGDGMQYNGGEVMRNEESQPERRIYAPVSFGV